MNVMSDAEIEVRCEIRDDERVMIVTLSSANPQEYQNFMFAMNYWLEQNRYWEAETIETH